MDRPFNVVTILRAIINLYQPHMQKSDKLQGTEADNVVG